MKNGAIDKSEAHYVVLDIVNSLKILSKTTESISEALLMMIGIDDHYEKISRDTGIDNMTIRVAKHYVDGIAADVEAFAQRIHNACAELTLPGI